MTLLTETYDEHKVKPLMEDTVNEFTKEKQKSLFIEGIFSGYGQKNKNGRIYPADVMHEAVDLYRENYINRNRALGEISHPADRLAISLERSAINVTEMKDRGDGYYQGKAKILTTPPGKLLKNLLSDGVQVGISSRGSGNTMPQNGYDLVTEFELKCFDVVFDPSCQPAIMNMISEATLENQVLTEEQTVQLQKELDQIVRNTDIITIRKKDMMRLMMKVIELAQINYDSLR